MTDERLGCLALMGSALLMGLLIVAVVSAVLR